MSDSLFNQANATPSFGLPDGGELGAMTLETHINGEPINLVYRAQYEVFDHQGAQLARELVSFAQQNNCKYALLVDGSCWIAEGRGLSFAAQLENNAHLNHYDMIVLPMDDMVYLASMDEGLLQQEKVYPVNKAMEFLLTCQDEQKLAILAGGMASMQLQQAGLETNCAETLITHGREAKAYTYKTLNLLLIQHRLFHPRLLLKVSILITVLLGLGLLFYYLTPKEVQEVVEEKVEQVQEVITAPMLDYVNNHASQVFLHLEPWLKAPWLDFLTTCRLTNINLEGTKVLYQGQWMDDLRQGCGNSRLRQVVQDNQLQLTNHADGWGINGIELPIALAALERTNSAQTLQQLQQLAAYLSWQLAINKIQRKGEIRDIQITLSGDFINQPILAILSQHFAKLPARIEQAQFIFDPDSLSIIKAELEITLFTTGEER